MCVCVCGGWVVDSHQGVDGGTWGGCYLILCFHLHFCLLFSHVLSLFLSVSSMIVVVSVSLFIVFFVYGPFKYDLLGHRNCCVCHVKLSIKSVSDHYSVDFLGKGRVFKFESLFRVSALL